MIPQHFARRWPGGRSARSSASAYFYLPQRSCCANRFSIGFIASSAGDGSPTMHNARRLDRRALCPKSGCLLTGGKFGHVAIKDRLLLRGENRAHIRALLGLQLRKLGLKSHIRVGRSVLLGGLVRSDLFLAQIAEIGVVLLLDRLKLLLLRGRQANSLREKLLIVSELELRAV